MSVGQAPVTAYVALWFPKASETFVFQEAAGLRTLGLPLTVFTLYGPLRRHLSPRMLASPLPVERLGLRGLTRIAAGICYWLRRDAGLVRLAFGRVPWRPWGGAEKTGENLWAFACGFALARSFMEAGVEHIHACWAGGPATAAWTASILTGIPFSFTGRAHDIFPPDGALGDKIRDAALVRGESRAAVRQLARYRGDAGPDIRLTYNGMPLAVAGEAPVTLRPPYRILALGRFVAKKGFEVLLESCALLRGARVEFRLTLAGDGPRACGLRRLARRLGLGEMVDFPGFVGHDQVPGLLLQADVLVMPSVLAPDGDRDGLPTVLLEALAHRVPVIASDLSGIGELVEDGVTGLLAPPGRPRELARALLRIFGDRKAALDMAERGHSRVRSRFDPAENNRRLLEIYRNLAAGGRGTARRRQTAGQSLLP